MLYTQVWSLWFVRFGRRIWVFLISNRTLVRSQPRCIDKSIRQIYVNLGIRVPVFDLIAYANCSHPLHAADAWRHPDHEHAQRYTELDYWRELGQTLETAPFAGLFLTDAYNVADRFRDSIKPTIQQGEQFPENDPLPLLTSIAGATDRLGVITTASTSIYSPYLLAKKLSTIDHLTDGRLGWNIVTSSGRLEFANAETARLGHDARYDRADE